MPGCRSWRLSVIDRLSHHCGTRSDLQDKVYKALDHDYEPSPVHAEGGYFLVSGVAVARRAGLIPRLIIEKPK